MLFIVLTLLSFGFTTTSYIFKKTALAAIGAGSWLMLAIYCYSLTVYPVSFDIYMGLTLFSVAMIVVSIITGLTFLTGDKKSDENIVEDDWYSVRNEIDELRKERDSTKFLYRQKRRRRSLL